MRLSCSQRLVQLWASVRHPFCFSLLLHTLITADVHSFYLKHVISMASHPRLLGNSPLCKVGSDAVFVQRDIDVGSRYSTFSSFTSQLWHVFVSTALGLERPGALARLLGNGNLGLWGTMQVSMARFALVLFSSSYHPSSLIPSHFPAQSPSSMLTG
jgi:hypothetical protein